MFYINMLLMHFLMLFLMAGCGDQRTEKNKEKQIQDRENHIKNKESIRNKNSDTQNKKIIQNANSHLKDERQSEIKILNMSDVNTLSLSQLSEYLILLHSSQNPSLQAQIAKIDQHFAQTKIEDYLNWVVDPTIESKERKWNVEVNGIRDFYWDNRMGPLYRNVSEQRKKELRKKWLVRALEAAKKTVLVGNVPPLEIEKLPSMRLLTEPFGVNNRRVEISELVPGSAGQDVNIITFVVDYFKGDQIKDIGIKTLVHIFAKESRGILISTAEWLTLTKDAFDILAGPQGVGNEAEASKILAYDVKGIFDFS